MLTSNLQKYDYLAKAIPAFRKLFGHAKTVGIEKIVQVGWMSDEHSAGEGQEDSARKERRENAGVGQSAWELRSPLWRSRKVSNLSAKAMSDVLTPSSPSYTSSTSCSRSSVGSCVTAR